MPSERGAASGRPRHRPDRVGRSDLTGGGVLPIGYLLTIALVTWCTFFALLPIREGRTAGLVSWLFGFLINELPFVAFFWVAASTLLAAVQGDLASPIGLTAFGLAILTTGGLAVIVWRARQTRPAVEQALAMALGAGWRSGIDAGMVGRLRRHLPLSRILFGPFFVRRRDVRRVANIPYGDAGEAESARRLPPPRSAFGRPRPRLSARWGVPRGQEEPRGPPAPLPSGQPGLGVYQRELPSRSGREVPRAPGRCQEGDRLGAGSRTRVRGRHGMGVRGGQLRRRSSRLACRSHTQRSSFQPGFERADTSVAAVISLYGYYGPIDTGVSRPSTPLAYVRPDAPPFFVAHGDHDTYVPVEGARRFQATLRQVSSQPVVYAELPGAQHSFDLFHSIRFETLIDGIEAFAARVRSTNGRRTAESGHGQPISG